jgi:CRP/FNR family cyclic AMP-dependent transcriptional regulator
MELIEIIKQLELFDGLTQDELFQVADICEEKRFHRGDLITKQGEPGEEFYIVTEGFTEILLEVPQRVVANLGPGQLIGEMAVVDQGPRSATVTAITEPTVVQVIKRSNFEALCKQNTHLGYVVVRNIALDLSFKLRHRNLSEK